MKRIKFDNIIAVGFSHITSLAKLLNVLLFIHPIMGRQ
jgi:hypothetical protein